MKKLAVNLVSIPNTIAKNNTLKEKCASAAQVVQTKTYPILEKSPSVDSYAVQKNIDDAINEFKNNCKNKYKNIDFSSVKPTITKLKNGGTKVELSPGDNRFKQMLIFDKTGKFIKRVDFVLDGCKDFPSVKKYKVFGGLAPYSKKLKSLDSHEFKIYGCSLKLTNVLENGIRKIIKRTSDYANGRTNYFLVNKNAIDTLQNNKSISRSSLLMRIIDGPAAGSRPWITAHRDVYNRKYDITETYKYLVDPYEKIKKDKIESISWDIDGDLSRMWRKFLMVNQKTAF